MKNANKRDNVFFRISQRRNRHRIQKTSIQEQNRMTNQRTNTSGNSLVIIHRKIE